MNRVFLFILLLFIVSDSFSQTDSIQIDSIESRINNQALNNTSSVINSTDYYRLMYENAKNENAKLISLLTTSLTVIIAVIIAIIGSSIFYNYRFNKKEYELLATETTNKLNDVQKKILKQNGNEIGELARNNKEKMNEEFSKISETYKTNFDTLKDSLNTIVTSFKQDVDKNFIIYDKSIEHLSKIVEEIKESAKKDLQFNEKSLKIDILDIKGDLFYMREWFSLALSTYVDQANLCVETNQKWQLEYILSDIIKSMNKTIELENTISNATKLNIEKLLSNIPTNLSDKKKEIVDNYKKIRVKDEKIANVGFGGGILGAF